MATSRNDMYILSTDVGFQNRVRASLLVTCVAVMFEAWTVAFHRERQTFAVQVISSPDIYKLIVANCIATDTNVISDATAAGTVALTTGNVATQAALVTDAHLDSAVTGQYNNFFRTPSG